MFKTLGLTPNIEENNPSHYTTRWLSSLRKQNSRNARKEAERERNPYVLLLGTPVSISTIETYMEVT